MIFNNSGRYKLISEATRLWSPAGIQTLLRQKCWEKLNIWINDFDRRCGHSLKEYERNRRLKIKHTQRTLNAANKSWLWPIQPLRAGFSTASTRGGETHWAKCVDGQSVSAARMQHRRCFEDFVYLFTSPNVSNAGILTTILPSGSLSNIMNVLILLEATLW